jgi:hypothetical protein
LPIAVAPRQVPELVSAGLAFSPYETDDDYSTSTPRRRMLWVEFAEAPEPGCTYFARVRSYAPDPLLLSRWTPPNVIAVVDPDVFKRPELSVQETEIVLDPEYCRVIMPGHDPDPSGLEAMQPLTAGRDERYYIVPLPPGLVDSSPELLGFFTYEFRVGRQYIVGGQNNPWSTAQGRFGPLLRTPGVQHPAPTMNCAVFRDTNGVKVTAAYANPVLEGKSLRPLQSRTDIWALLYARPMQADGTTRRNVLLGRTLLALPQPDQDHVVDNDTAAIGGFDTPSITEKLRLLYLPASTPLSVLCVEVLSEVIVEERDTRIPKKDDPLGASLGLARVLRTSRLLGVTEQCTHN